MPVTILVNKMTPSHKGSNGTSIAFPDVCKTPTPAGPVPIPYPNIAKSSDLVNGTTTVKMDGQPVSIKGCNFMISTGDEAGTALGVVSNKIKGKAEFANYSFDVKADGQNVCRLLDPMQQNMGSLNTFGPAQLQQPNAAMSPELEACREVTKKQKKQKKDESAWSNSGIIKKHQKDIQQGVDHLKKYTLFFRKTSKHCDKWIKAHHKPKPHEVITASTLKEGISEEKFKGWIEAFWAGRTKFLRKRSGKPKEHYKEFVKALHDTPPGVGPEGMEILESYLFQDPLPPESPDKSSDFYGLVVSLVDGEPLIGYGKDSCNNVFWGKWITGDYDLMDILTDATNCGRKLAAENFAKIKKELNKRMGWDGIQHGPQAYWVAKSKGKGGHDYATFSMPALMREYMQSRVVNLKSGREPAEKFQVPIAKGRTMPVLDNELTVVSPNAAPVRLDDYDEIKGALKCFGCAKEEAEKPMTKQVAK